MLHFIETPLFSKQIDKLLDDDNYTELQLNLINNPEQGDLIQGTGGVRKVRWALSNKGKSGGVRIIYYYMDNNGVFFMLLAYPKNKKVTLTAQEKSSLAKITQQIKEVYNG